MSILGLNCGDANDCFNFTRYGEIIIEQGGKQPKLLVQTENTRLELLLCKGGD